MIRIAIVDDHPIVREGLASILEDEPDFAIVASVGSAEDLFSSLRAARPDLVVIDLELPGIGGIAALERLAALAEGPRALVFSAFESDQDVRAAVAAGATGYLLKGSPAAELTQAIRAVAAGGRYVSAQIAARAIFGANAASGRSAELTKREREVLRLVAAGLANKAIAARLGIAERTAKYHVASIMAKLGAENRAQAVALAAQQRLR
ncbi:MAG: response regulator [Vulcanimicrobiaceae bacterium]